MSMALANEHIFKTLCLIIRRYNRAAVSKTRYASVEMEYLSKIAILELGGWVEERIDSILLDYVYRKIVDPTEQQRYKKEVVGRVFGFEFDRNVRPLFERVLGAAHCEAIRNQLMAHSMLFPLAAELHSLWSMRGRAAHTNWEGITRVFDAPSMTLARLKNIYPAMCMISRVVNAM